MKRVQFRLNGVFFSALLLIAGCGEAPQINDAPPASELRAAPQAKSSRVPEYVTTTLEYVREHGRGPEGYEGGRRFGNYEGHLPKRDRSGRAVNYKEWDVKPHREHVNRGAERLITGSDGSAWYTNDHYETFTKIE